MCRQRFRIFEGGIYMTEEFTPITFDISKAAHQIITSTSVKQNISESEALDLIIKDWAVRLVQEDMKEAQARGKHRQIIDNIHSINLRLESIEDDIHTLWRLRD